MSVLMFMNLKGGVAKTTNAVAIAEFLAEAGNKVLVIDADGYLVERLRRNKNKLRGLGLLWSLYRQENSVHRQMVPLVACNREEIFKGFPDPFQTIVPNATAIVKATEITSNSLNEKYTYPFAKMYKALVGEIVERCEKLDKARKRPRRRLASV